jgi:hypothetical protein
MPPKKKKPTPNNNIKNLKKLAEKKKITPNNIKKFRNIIRRLPLSGSEPKFSWEPWGSSGQVHDNCYDYAFGSYSNKRTRKSVPGNRSGVGSNGLTFTTCRGITDRILSDNPKGAAKTINPNARCPEGYYKVMCFVAPNNDFGDLTGDFHFLKQVGRVRYRTRPNDTVQGIAKFFHVHPATVLRAARLSTSPMSRNDGKIANEQTELYNLDKINFNVKNKVNLRPGRIIEFPVNLFAHKQGWAGGPIMIDASGKTIIDPRKANLNYHPGFHYTKFCSAWAVHNGMAQTGNNKNR